MLGSAQTRAEAAEKEVAHVKEKAWKMMADMEAQLKATKVAKVSVLPLHHLCAQPGCRLACAHSGSDTRLNPSVAQDLNSVMYYA